MLYNVLFCFMIFFCYAVMGFLCEITICSIDTKKPVMNRGFLLGPYLPIYGAGAYVIVELLGNYSKDPIVLFVLAFVICTLVEYFTSLIMEKLFKVRWWDYSKEPFNMDGRVCLLNSVMFGLGGMLLVYLVNPILETFLHAIPNTLFIILGLTFFTVFIADFIITVVILFRVKSSVGRLATNDVDSDDTDEIRAHILTEIKKSIFFTSRLLGAFPKADKLNKSEFARFRQAILHAKDELSEKKKIRKKKKNK